MLKSELTGMFLSVVFDGTTRYGEAMAILVRYIDAGFCIQQRLVRMQLVQKSMCGEEVARELISLLHLVFTPIKFWALCVTELVSTMWL